MKNVVEDFLTLEDEIDIIEAIRQAERNTSGEIRVHLETSAGLLDDQNHMDRAVIVFDLLHMNNTKHGNGVLIYIAVDDRKLVILGDKGINKVVPLNFWESTQELITSSFKKGATKQGLVSGIQLAGEQLKKYFPFEKGDIDEISNEISKGS